MLGKPRILSLFPNSLNKFNKHEHSCKILYVPMIVPSFISRKAFIWRVFSSFLNSHCSLLHVQHTLSKCMSINGRRQKRRNNTNKEGWNIGTFKEPAVLKRKGGIIPLGGMEHYRRLMKYAEGGRGWVNKLLNLPVTSVK